MPSKVRPQGAAWVKPQKQVDRQQDSLDRQSQVPGDFHNPYNFVPALPRHQVIKNSKLGDRSPVGHDRYFPGYWSGKITVNLITKTPLLIPDASQMIQDGEHKTYPLRQVNGKPYLPPTSIKGMLRTAYEAVTNSRLSVFEQKHDARLFYRMPAGDGLSLVPAIVEGNQIKLLHGTTTGYPSLNDNQKWQIPGNLMYAAWLPSYRQGDNNLHHPNIEHGDLVRVWLEQYQKKNRDGRVMFKHWRVREIVGFDRSLGDRPVAGNAHGDYAPTGEEMIQPEGYLCVTGRNIKGKHDERVFFNMPNPNNRSNYTYSLDELGRDWEYLIKDYQQLHENQTRDEGLEWSRHVNGSAECRLVNSNRPTLCYAFVDNSSYKPKITALYPVMISRAIYTEAPSDLLSPNKDSLKLHPAQELSDLSPADRVFGWVNQNGSGAYRGNLRIYNVNCVTDDAIEHLGTQGLPLAILGQPKPQQGRFYAARDDRGTPFAAGVAKQEFYQPGTGLRGRKVYPHHRIVADDYWNRQVQQPSSTSKPKPKLKSETAPLAPISNINITREYLRPKTKDGIDRDSQNRSITEWVKPDVTFKFEIDVTNLSSVELGALLWLLDLPADNYHRLGGGKPLGFGSVALAVDWEGTELRNGEQLKDYYSSLLAPPLPTQFDRSRSVADFQQAVRDSYGSGDFLAVSFIKAFCRSARGFDDGKPIHYPRVTHEPHPDGESFKWFVANEKNSDRQYSLGSLSDDAGLPIWQ